ncbi:MAG TPA: signal peptide peptidase SppA [Candidatus Manganitrophaceae bacterium]|nr:signal peptide peptidase SppA [Candidatus Manganitrophaceae bacterium]
MPKKPLLIGAIYFLLFSLLFFGFMFWVAHFSEKGVGIGEKIALIRIEGVILDSNDVVEELRRYRKDDSVKAILLRIDSPGGGVVPSQEIYDEVKQIRQEGKKKVVTSMGTVAASGGYYIASASDKIIANPGTLTGSIGVIMEFANVEGLLQKIGVESVVIKSGKNKDLGSPFRKMKEEERVLLQGVIDDVHGQFIEAVAESRSLEVESVRALADGRIFTGRQAKKIGLVDELGSFQDAVQKTAELAGIQGEPRMVEERKRFSIFEIVRSQLRGSRVGHWMSLGAAAPLPSASVRLNFLLAF